MRLIIITQRDPIFVDEFLTNINYENFNEVFIYDTPNFGAGKLKGLVKFYKLFGVLKTFNSVIKVLTRSTSLPKNVIVKHIKFSQAEEDILSNDWCNDDVLISVSAPHRVTEQILRKFKKKYNIHCGKLPQFAGMMPMFWQFYENQTSYTITLHELANEIDAGNDLT